MLEVGLRNCSRAFLIDHLVDQAHRRFRQDTDRRHDDLELIAAQLFAAQQDFVFPIDEDVPDAAIDEVVVAPRAPESSTGTLR